MAWSPMWVLLLYALLALQAQVTGRSIKKKKKKKREKRPRCDFVNQRKNESNERRGKWKSFLGAQYKIRDICSPTEKKLNGKEMMAAFSSGAFFFLFHL
ncbi:hypothetical protein QQP08_009070 [Theobroma cacao]|nr:hypothetical protein QQP08_008698 [Theobroma cacao]WRX16583.1 hypothetical protein QQP08_009070 [Theobroma cacao]